MPIDQPSQQRQHIYLSAFDMHCVVHQIQACGAILETRLIITKILSTGSRWRAYWKRAGSMLFSSPMSSILRCLRRQSRCSPADRGAGTGRRSADDYRCHGRSDQAPKLWCDCPLTYELPYKFAKTMTTLDHLTKGRVAWNIVTSYQQSAAVNLGLDTQIAHDERYNMADEFMEVCYKLWEGSWEDDAVERDIEKGVYTDPAKVHDINHVGKYYKVRGAHLCEPSPQRTPFLFQAGASARGRKFAATHAEAVFLIGSNPKDTRTVVAISSGCSRPSRVVIPAASRSSSCSRPSWRRPTRQLTKSSH